MALLVIGLTAAALAAGSRVEANWWESPAFSFTARGVAKSVETRNDTRSVNGSGQTIVEGNLAMFACVTPPAGINAWYQGENNAVDIQNGANGTLENGVAFSGGKVGQAFSFDGSDDSVLIPTQNLGNSYTIEFWLNPNATQTNFAHLVSNNWISSNFGAFYLQPNMSLDYWQGAGQKAVTAANAVTPNQWSHIALTRDNSDGKTRIYVNGTLAATSSTSFAAPFNNQVRLGYAIVASDSRYKGLMDEVSFYTTTLTQTDIQGIFSAGVDGKCVPTQLRILPVAASAQVNSNISFFATGGTPPYSYSLFANNSGGSIVPATGVYTAGPHVGTDTVRVTDSTSTTADTTVNVQPVCGGGIKTWDGGGVTNNWSEAANWCQDTVPTSTDSVVFDSTSTKNSTIDTNISLAGFTIDAGYNGTISAGNSTVTVNGAFSQAGGTYNGGTAANTFKAAFNLTGGDFTATSATTTIESPMTVTDGTFFHHGNGTFLTGFGFSYSSSTTLDLNNFTIGRIANLNTGTFRVANNFTLGTIASGVGRLASGTVEASGNVDFVIDSGSQLGTLKIVGNATRTITLPDGYAPPNLIINAPNVTFTGAGVNISSFQTVDIQNAAQVTNATAKWNFGSFTLSTANAKFSQGAGDVNFVGQFFQTGGTYHANSGTINSFSTFNVSGGTFFADNSTMNFGFSVNQTGGTFNGGSATVNYNNQFFVSGGTYIATTGATTINNNTFQIVNNAAFQPNGGLVRFTTTTNLSSGDLNATFSNVIVDTPSSINITSTNIGVEGNLTITNGGIQNSGNNGTVFVKGDLTMGAGATNVNTANLTFSGTGNQTFINNGGLNFSGTWTVSKPSGILTAATSMILPSGADLAITSGTLYLNNGSNLTTRALTVGTNGRLVNDSATTITLGGNVANSGKIDLQGSGALCPEADTILIRSSVSGAQRSWTGSGAYRLVDVDVKDMGGSGTKNVFSGTSSGGNNSSWIFNTGCPATLSISPLTVDKFVAQGQTFSAGGGVIPYSFSLATNNSGGSINAGGNYTAGTTPNVTDTVRVTDAFGSTADATVNVFSGPPTKLGYTVQPSNTVAGQSIAPSVKVAIQDASGNTVGNATDAVTIAIFNNAGGGTLSGTLAQNAVNGVATFDNLSINKAGTGYTLRVTSGSLTAATSGGFNITHAPAHHLAFSAQPSNAAPNTAISPAVTVNILDAFDNLASTANDAVTIAIANNPASGTLSGTTTQNAVNGVATFSNLSINNFGSGYTLSATSGSLTSATSSGFDILNPFVVTTTADSGFGSLRNAITASNSTPGTQTITFNIAGTPPFSIAPLIQLPSLTQPVIIDATTQPGFAGNPVVVLHGTSSINRGILVSGGNSEVRGFVINGFASGLTLASSGNIAKGNFIGTDLIGTTGVPNTYGVVISGDNNIIGGLTAVERNLISGNSNSGILLISGSGNIIQGNVIGRDVTNTANVPNGEGLFFAFPSLNAVGNVIGGTAPGAGNVIAGNTKRGIRFEAPISTGDVNNLIRGNSIFGNSNLGISLTTNIGPIDDPRPNDQLDADTGPNGLQNYPDLTSATSGGGNTNIAGTLSSEPSKSYTLDFYSNTACDPSGYGEGETYLGSTSLNTDATGIMAFNAVLPVSTAVGQFITATATQTGVGTSEFSRCVQVAPNIFSISGHIADASNRRIKRLRISVSGVSGRFTTDSNGDFTIPDLPGGATYTITPSARRFSFLPASLTVSNLNSNVTGQDSVGFRNATIRGSVQTAVNGVSFALSNTTVTLSGPVNQTVVTDSLGKYSFSGLSAGSYTVTASQNGFTFAPSSANVALAGVSQDVDFTGTPNQSVTGRVVFSSPANTPSIGVMNADTSSAVPMASSARINTVVDGSNPSISRDGSKIAYKCRASICTSFYDGGALARLGDQSGPDDKDPAWSPDGSKIAFVRSVSGSSTLRVMNADGSNITTVYNNPSNRNLSDPSWTADGAKLVFTESSGALSYPQSINIDGSGLTRLTQGENDAKAAVSYDGTKIAFIRRTGGALLGNIYLMNLNGTGQTPVTNDPVYDDVAWSPDGSKLAFTRVLPGQADYGVMDINGNIILSGAPLRVVQSREPSWGPDPAPAVPSGSNVTVTNGSVSVTFGNVITPGVLNVTPIQPCTFDDIPGGFAEGQFIGFEVSTTAVFTTPPPVTICFQVPGSIDEDRFNLLHIVHVENGVPSDVTVSRDYNTRTICAAVTSFSPFVIAEEADPALPRISGLVTDSDGEPLVAVPISMVGSESRNTVTDSEGSFTFPNLAIGGNYDIAARLPGYVFNPSSGVFVGITGEKTVMFSGTPSITSVSGRTLDESGNPLANVQILLDGGARRVATTNSSGAYSFTGLPGDVDYSVTPFAGNLRFGPVFAELDRINGPMTDVDFQVLAPTAASVSVGGRVIQSNGAGIGKARITLTDANGNSLTAETNAFGYYRFDGVESGMSYIVSISSKRFTFAEPSRIISVGDDAVDIDFIGEPSP